MQIAIRDVHYTAPPEGQPARWHGRYPYPLAVHPRWEPLASQVPYIRPSFSGFGDGQRAKPPQAHVPHHGQLAQTSSTLPLPAQVLPSGQIAEVRELDRRTEPLTSDGAPNAASFGKNGRDSVPDAVKVKCANCGAVDTPYWRRGMNGETNCNACGPYYSTVIPRFASIRTKANRTM